MKSFCFTKLKSFAPALTIVFSGCWLIYFWCKNTTPVDPGDGLLHHFIAQASWTKKQLFLDHWGKPLYTLFSSPFAQFGYNGSVVFTILLFLLTCFLSFDILRKFEVNGWISATFPLVLLSANELSKTVLGGLTEPLFNCLLIAAVYFYLHERKGVAVVLISLLPFARSEGMLVLVLSFFALVYDRQWRLLPYLLSGFLLYALLGTLLGKGLFWYFNEDPYQTNGLYGKGSWLHYLISYRNYLGNPGLYFVLLTLVYVGARFRTLKQYPMEVILLIYSAAIFFGILFVHSYLWATGQKGAYGLTRLGTQGVPLFLLSCVILISKWKLLQNVISKGVFGIFSGIMMLSLISTKVYPRKRDKLEIKLEQAATRIKKLYSKSPVVAYHPSFHYYYGSNPYMKCGVNMYLPNSLISGTIVVYDTQFGPKEAGLNQKIRGGLREIYRFGHPLEKNCVLLFLAP